MPPAVQAEPISRGRAPAQMPPGQSMNAPPRQPASLSYCPSMPPDSARIPSTPGRAMMIPGHSQMMATPRNKDQSNVSQQHRPGYQPGPPVVVAYPAQQSKAAWTGELPGMPVSARKDPHPGLSLNAPPRRPPAALSYSPSLVVNSGQVQPRGSTSYCPSLLANAARASPVQTRGSASYCPNLVAEAAKTSSGQNNGPMSYCPSFVDVAKANLVRGQKGGSLSYCPSLAVDVAKAAKANSTHGTTASPLAGCETMITTPNPKDVAAIGQQYHAMCPQPGLPNCQSLVIAYPAQQRRPNWTRELPNLQFASAYFSKQHPAKVNTGMPNADAVLEGLDYLGIADGVSGVHHLGLTPDALPWELLRSCGKGLFAASARGEPKPGKEMKPWITRLIQESYDTTTELGATTMLLAALKGHSLVTACLGDSAILILRPVSVAPLRLQRIFKTEPGRYDERRPVQIQRLEGLDGISAEEVIEGAAVAVTPIQPGDFLILGTDGLFDNLSDFDVQRVVEGCCHDAVGRIEELEETAAALVDLAIRSVRLGADATAAKPWTRSGVPANNADDTTALVAVVQPQDVSSIDVAGELHIKRAEAARANRRRRRGLMNACGVALGRGNSDAAQGRQPSAGSRHRSLSVDPASSSEGCVIA